MKITELSVSGGLFEFAIDPSLSEGEKDVVSVLRKCASSQRSRSHGVGSIASGRYCVHKDCLIDDLVSELNTHETLLSVGVVDDDGRVLGIIIRRELFNLLGRSYGEDFAHSRAVSRVMKDVKRFRFDTNIFSVAESITKEIRDATIHHFLLEDADAQFAGTFSTRDLLVYLSDITKKDIDTATMIQRRIVPEKGFLNERFIEAAASVQMAKGVGGDFYSMNCYAEGRYLICMADVSGKGMGASLITSIMGGLVHSYDFTSGIPLFIRKLNAYIHRTFDCEKYLTAVFADIDTATGEMTVWDMGHSLLYIFRNGRLLAFKSNAKNMPVGIVPEIEAESITVRLRKNDIILMITDGVVEQCNEKREEYGLTRISSIIRENPSAGMDELRDLAAADISRFRGAEPQHDDISFLLARYSGDHTV
jgi:sigma-B regulation protein RsbU (phosphoserine phosphatase)